MDLRLLRLLRSDLKVYKQSFRRIHKTISLCINPNNVKEVKIPVPWGHIAGKWWGDRNKQPILALHGWQDNAGTFDPLLELLPESFSVLAVDEPGHGLSSHIPSGMVYSTTTHLLMCRRIHNHYNWTEPITILGHSYGAGIGLVYAALYPESVKGLIMIDVVKLIAADKKFMSRLGDHIDSLIIKMTRSAEENKKYSLKEIEDRWIAGTKKSLTRNAVKVLMRRGVELDKESGKYTLTRDPRLKIWSVHYYDENQQLEFARNTKCDLLVIRYSGGKFLDASLKNAPHYLSTIEKSAKSFKMITVDGTHHGHLNEPEKVAPIITEFLETHKL